MTRYHPDGDLAPRDVVARSIVREAERTGGPVFLTLAHLDADFVRRRFPTIAEMCRQRRPRSRARSDSGRAGGALHHGRRRHRRVGPDVAAGTVRGGRGGLHRRARREPAGEQLAARGPRVRRARGRRDAAAAPGGADESRPKRGRVSSDVANCDFEDTGQIPGERGPKILPAPVFGRRPRSDVAVGRPVPDPRGAAGRRRPRSTRPPGVAPQRGRAVARRRRVAALQSRHRRRG